MSSSDGLGVVTLELRGAFRQPGCPICRVKQTAADQYIFHLLWENVNDYTTRLHLVRGLGFCPEHTWQVYHTEVDQFGDGLGVSIIYEHLTRLIVEGLGNFQTGLLVNVPVHGHWWQRAWTRLRAAARQTTSLPHRPCMEGLAPTEECRVCFHAKTTEQYDIEWLVQGCADMGFRNKYAASDGLCLTHLRQALERAARSDPEAARFLADDAARRLSELVTDLSEYGRKHSWQYRHEVKTDGERDSPHRASWFFGGQDGRNGRTERTGNA